MIQKPTTPSVGFSPLLYNRRFRGRILPLNKFPTRSWRVITDLQYASEKYQRCCVS